MEWLFNQTGSNNEKPEYHVYHVKLDNYYDERRTAHEIAGRG
jgi:hypothetical protein